MKKREKIEHLKLDLNFFSLSFELFSCVAHKIDFGQLCYAAFFSVCLVFTLFSKQITNTCNYLTCIFIIVNGNKEKKIIKQKIKKTRKNVQ